MSEQTSECGESGKLAKTENKGRSKNSKSTSDTKIEREVSNKCVESSMSQPIRDDRSDPLSGSNVRPKLTGGTIEPRIHRAEMIGLSSILASARRPVASSSRIDRSAEASTSVEARRSILREKDFSTLNPESSVFARIRQFWTRYPMRETKRSIVFVDQRTSDISLESVVTLIGTSRPLPKSALRRTGSLRSSCSSVRFSLPPETLREENKVLMKIGNWDVVCDIGNDEITDGSTATWRSLRHTTLCRIAMCLSLGLILPSVLIVPVLVYEDISNDSIP